MITLDIPTQNQAIIQNASRMAGMSIEQFFLSSAMEKAKQFVQEQNSVTEPTEYQSEAWLVGQGLFGCYQGSADLSENAKAIAEQRIKEKYAKRTS